MMLKIYTVYRCLYGEDFIKESIKSVADFSDKIFVFWTNKPLGGVTEVKYKDEIIKFPRKIDNIIDVIEDIGDSRISLVYDHVDNNDNQFTHLVNDIILPNYPRPDIIVFLEPDMVYKKENFLKCLDDFEKSNLVSASAKQIELWRRYDYRIPERFRPSSTWWNLNKTEVIPLTGKSANVSDLSYLNGHVHNFGFCIKDINMYWKHLLAIAFSKKIGDSAPNENWYDGKWLSWDFEKNNVNLEISLGFESCIPCSFPYDIKDLPETVLDNHGKFWEYMENR